MTFYNFIKNKNIERRGFTLMEVLVSMSIFVILTLAILTVHTQVLHTSQQTLAYNRIQQEAQLIVDYDYNGYSSPVTNPEDELALEDLTGSTYVFSLSGDSLVVSVDGGDQQPIPSQYVNVSDINFYIEPTSSPFNIDTPPETQPRVTMVITFTSSKADQTASLTVQQTVPQRSGGIVE